VVIATATAAPAAGFRVLIVLSGAEGRIAAAATRERRLIAPDDSRIRRFVGDRGLTVSGSGLLTRRHAVDPDPTHSGRRELSRRNLVVFLIPGLGRGSIPSRLKNVVRPKWGFLCGKRRSDHKRAEDSSETHSILLL